MSSYRIERAIEVVGEIQTNIEECCESIMDKEEVEQLLIELKDILIDLRNGQS